MKKYDIKTTDKETLRKWFYLMTLGRAIDEKAPSYYCNLSAGLIMPRMPGTTGYNSPWDKYSIRIRTFSSPITGIC